MGLSVLLTMRGLLFLACLAGAYEHEDCYQCAYNPADVVVEQVRVSHTVFDEVKVPRTVYHGGKVPRVEYHGISVPRIVYDTHTVNRTIPGGWDPCENGFTHEEAIMYGITINKCFTPCYLRIEGNNLYRGCYQDEFDVDPLLLGCHEQAGAIYCFCEGVLCNNHHLSDS